MTDTPLPSRDAAVLGDRYRLIDRIGAGGTAVVWRAHDELLDRDVAVKLLNPAIDERLRPVLRQEAKAVAQLRSVHAAHMYDYGEWRRADGRTTPYLVMELIDGVPLTERLADGRAMPWREAATMVAEVCEALAAAHARGLVHRDIKPDNIMLTDAGVKVIDFGISASSGTADATNDGHLVGTAAYVAPERLAGVPVAAPADVYSVGVLLYRALTGHLPWDAQGKTDLLRAHLFEEPAAFPPLQDGLSTELADLCYACLAKDPNQRPTPAQVTQRIAVLLRAGTVRRRRLLFPVAATVVLLTAAAIAAAAAHPHPGAAAAAAATLPEYCTATFSINRDWGVGFDAVLTVTNTTATALYSPQVTFTFPGDQQLTNTAPGTVASIRIDQQGAIVAATASGGPVRPHDVLVVPINATYRDTNPIPTLVSLDHHGCVTTITGAAYRPTPGAAASSLNPTGSGNPAPAPDPGPVNGPTPTGTVSTLPAGTTSTPTTPPIQATPPTPTSAPTVAVPTPSPSCTSKGNGKCHKGDSAIGAL